MKYQYFIGSRWRNKEAVLELTNKLRRKGRVVYCFLEGDGTNYELKNYEETYDTEKFMKMFENIPDWKNSKAVQEVFNVDMNALKESENFILLLPAGKSAHIEAGAAYGMRKPCILVGEQKETESSYMIFDKFFDSIDAFIDSL